MDDQGILEDFFSDMITSEYFGYVLFGEKPMAAAGFETEFTPEENLSENAKKHHHVHLGWQTWEKYSSLFPSEKYVLRLSKSPLSKDYHWIVLINKETTLLCVQNHLKIFKKLLGDDITPKSVLQSLISSDSIFKDALNQHDVLLGILLGYGKNNSIKFQQCHRSIERNAPFKNKYFHKASVLDAFNNQSRDLIQIALPRFAADLNHPESKSLYQSYLSTQVQLTNIYRERKYLQRTLDQFVSK